MYTFPPTIHFPHHCTRQRKKIFFYHSRRVSCRFDSCRWFREISYRKKREFQSTTFTKYLATHLLPTTTSSVHQEHHLCQDPALPVRHHLIIFGHRDSPKTNQNRFLHHLHHFCPVHLAQSVERKTFNLVAVGSTPTVGIAPTTT